jgi:hypothetical protein
MQDQYKQEYKTLKEQEAAITQENEVITKKIASINVIAHSPPYLFRAQL